jgi:hypothetical protein
MFQTTPDIVAAHEHYTLCTERRIRDDHLSLSVTNTRSVYGSAIGLSVKRLSLLRGSYDLEMIRHYRESVLEKGRCGLGIRQ